MSLQGSGRLQGRFPLVGMAYRPVLRSAGKTSERTHLERARARHTTRKTKKGKTYSVAYKEARQKERENELDDLLEQRAPEKPLEGPLGLEFIAGMPIPASTSKKDREAMLRGEIAHTRKPDLDNLGKQLLDAMTRAKFWHDDRQVVSLRCSKRYAAAPGWEVAVYSLEASNG